MKLRFTRLSQQDLENVRRLPVIKFPYTVFYRVSEKDGEVQVLRILHGARIRDLGTVPEDD
ncbi:MAG: type II toxin-antitoxin system RelE/ParE family toxin [Hyphomicrobiaceae bacterium]